MTRKGPPKFSPWRPLLRTLLLRVPDSLDQAGVFGAVLVTYRLGGLEEGFLVRRNELDAGRLQLGGRLGDVVVPQLALFELRLARKLLDQVLVALRQLVPAHLRVDEDLGDDQVAGEAVDLAARCLVVVLREQGRLVVLGAVD